MNRSFELMAQEEPDEDLAALAAQLGRFLSSQATTRAQRSGSRRALEIAEALWLPETLSQALNTKAVILALEGPTARGAQVLLRHALEVALEHDKPSAALRAYYNLADTLGAR